jgi:GT2 family glycosyltransferase
LLAFGICVGPTDSYERVCRPSLPAGALVEERRHQLSIFSAYNSILDAVTPRDDLEGVVLLHDDVELGPRFAGDVRSALALGAGVVGAAGALRPTSISWWKAETRGFVQEGATAQDFGGGCHRVDTVDGLVMVLSMECARSVRFDDHRYRGFHGYDADFCYRARAAGFTVMVNPLDLIHHTNSPSRDFLEFRRADLTWRRKWGLIDTRELLAETAKLTIRQMQRAVQR